MRKRVSILLVVLAATAVPIWYAFEHGYRSTTSYMCVRCRAVQRVTTFFGRKSANIEETDYSRWFAQRQTKHTHQWGWCGTTITYYPITYAQGCGRQHPIWRVLPEWQQQFVKSASASQVENFYEDLDSPDHAIQQQTVEMVIDKVTGRVK